MSNQKETQQKFVLEEKERCRRFTEAELARDEAEQKRDQACRASGRQPPAEI